MSRKMNVTVDAIMYITSLPRPTRCSVPMSGEPNLVAERLLQCRQNMTFDAVLEELLEIPRRDHPASSLTASPMIKPCDMRLPTIGYRRRGPRAGRGERSWDTVPALDGRRQAAEVELASVP